MNEPNESTPTDVNRKYVPARDNVRELVDAPMLAQSVTQDTIMDIVFYAAGETASTHPYSTSAYSVARVAIVYALNRVSTTRTTPRVILQRALSFYVDEVLNGDITLDEHDVLTLLAEDVLA